MSFINPLFLAAMGTALLPVLYHLVRRMRADRVRFSSLMFLRATPKELVRKRRLRDWLLLILRALIFALLAFAFARPFLPQDQVPFADPAENRSTVILLDNSYSMQYGDRFESARTQALEYIDRASSQDELSVVAFSDEVQQLTSLDADLSLHRTAVQNPDRASFRPTNFYNSLLTAQEILQDARHENRRIVLISDLQIGGWTESIDNWKLAADIEFEPVKVGPSNPENTYVDAVELTQQRRGQQVIVQYGARIRQNTAADLEERTIQLSLDGNPVGEQTVSGSNSTTVRFQEAADDPGFFHGMIVTSETDQLPVDDRYFLTYAVDPQPSILTIGGSSADGVGDAFFLERAFDVGEESLFEYSTTDPSGLSLETFSDYDVLFLTNLPEITAAQTERLRTYIENGGSVILSFGEQTNVSNLSETLVALNIGTLSEVSAPDPPSSPQRVLGEVDLSHPIFDVFTESGTRPILRSNFRRYLHLSPDSTTRVVARYNNGDPMLVEQSIGAGKILVYTSSLSTAWTDFPISESYVPLLYQMARYAAEDGHRQYMYRVGDRVALPASPGAEWEIRSPDGNLYSVETDESGTGFFTQTEIPGQYVAASGDEQFRFSVNLDTRESNLESRDQEEAYAAIVPSTEERLASQEQRAATVDTAAEEHEQKLWRTILLIVIGLFVIETVIANRRLALRDSSRD